jgi:TRAP transporter TAXI family solute receptor
MKRALLLSFLIACVSLSLTCPAAAKDARILIGATGAASGHYAYWVAVGEAIKKFAPGISPTVVETGATNDNADRLVRKQIDMGLGNIDTAYNIYYGDGKWKGKPHHEIRWMWTYTKNPMDIVVREDSGVKTIYDLNGKKFCAGARGTGGEKLLQEVFDVLGIKPDYYRGGYSDASNALEDRQIVGLAKWAAGEETGDALITRLATTTKLRWLGISDDDFKKIQKKLIYVLPYRHPPNVYKGQDYEVKCLGTTACCFATSNLSADVGYRVAKAAYQGRSLQEQAYPSFKKIDMFRVAVQYSSVPLHAGTVKICKELGIEVPKRLIPPEYK